MPTRLALWTPLPPLRSGIADYSAELLPYLLRCYDVEIFIDKSYRPERSLQQRYKIFNYTTFAERHQAQPFDIIVYQLGAANQHFYMVDAIQKWPGLVVLHDLYMGAPLYRSLVQQGSGNKRFAQYLQHEHPSVKQEFDALLRLHGKDYITATDHFFSSHYFLDWVIRSSLGQIVHMPYAAQTLKLTYPAAQPYVVPMGLFPPDTTESAEQLRVKFKIKPSAFVIGVFGKISKYKGHQLCVEAIRQLLPDYPDLFMVIVGPYIQSDYVHQLQAIIDEGGISNHVHLAGYLDQEQFNQVLQVCDVVVNLRFPAQMQMSSMLVRALAAGKPVIISDIPDWNMIPDDACLRLSHGDNDAASLEKLLLQLITDPALRERLGQQARDYFNNNSTLEVMSSKYEQIITQYTNIPLENTVATGLQAMQALPPISPSDQSDQVELPRLPIENVSSQHIRKLIRSWHKLENATSNTSIIQQRPKIVDFVFKTLRRIRSLGIAWQSQGLIYEALAQQQEILKRKIDEQTVELNTLKAELEALRQSSNKPE